MRLAWGPVALITLLAACTSVVSHKPAALGDLRPDPAVRYGTLDNGLRYAIVQNATPTRRGALRLRMNVGWNFEHPAERGVAHLLEHMAFKGSVHLPDGKIIPHLQAHGLTFGTHINAYTSFDETVYSLDLPGVTAEAVDAGLLALREISSELTLGADAMDRERRVVMAEDRSQDAASRETDFAQLRFLFPEAKFIDRLLGAQPDVVASVSADEVRRFYSTWYRPDRAFLLFVGDADPTTVEQQIKERFSSWAASGATPSPPEMGRTTPRGLDVGLVPDARGFTSVTLASIEPWVAGPDTPDKRFRGYLKDIGNSILNERLYRLALSDTAPFASASVSQERMYSFARVQTMQVVAKSAQWEPALKAAEQELRRAFEFGFTHDEVTNQLRATRTSAAESARSASRRETDGYVFALMYAERESRTFTHPADDQSRYESYEKRVTPEAVRQALVQAWGREEPVVLLVSDALPAGGEARVRQVLQESRIEPVTRPQDVKPVQFAYTNFGPRGEVVERRHDPLLDVTMVRFANGVRATLKRTSFEDDRVNVSVRIGGGAMSQIGAAPGLAWVFSNTFISGGLLAHDFLELDRTREGRMANLSLQATLDGFNLGGQTTPETLLYQLQVLAAYVTSPAFRAEPLERYQLQTEQTYDQLSATPSGAWQLESSRLLYSGHPRVAYPRKSELLAWTTDRLREATRPALSSGPIEIGVVGALELEETIGHLSRTFGSLPARESMRPAVDSDREASMPQGGGPPVVIRYTGEGRQALVATQWPTGDDRDARRTAVLDLAGRVVKGRLLERLREREGAAYHPLAYHAPSAYFRDFGYFSVNVDVAEDEVDRIFGVIDESVASVAEGVTGDELERARRHRLEQFRLDLEDNLFWLQVAERTQTDPDMVSRLLGRPDVYRAVSAEEVSSAARHYLRPERAYRIAVLPPAGGPK